MSTSIQIPVTLRPSRTKAALLLLVCLAFVAIFITLAVRDGKPMGYLYGGLFALGVPVFAIQFHPKAAFLHLAADGFTFCVLFRTQMVQWAHVREFVVISLGLNRKVAWNFASGYPASGSARAISKSLSGYEAALPDTYGMKPQELADLMNRLRQQYGDTQDA